MFICFDVKKIEEVRDGCHKSQLTRIQKHDHSTYALDSGMQLHNHTFGQKLKHLVCIKTHNLHKGQQMATFMLICDMKRVDSYLQEASICTVTSYEKDQENRNQRENKNSFTTDSPVGYDTSAPPSLDPTGCKQSKVLQKDGNRIVANA